MKIEKKSNEEGIYHLEFAVRHGFGFVSYGEYYTVQFISVCVMEMYEDENNG